MPLIWGLLRMCEGVITVRMSGVGVTDEGVVWGRKGHACSATREASPGTGGEWQVALMP